MASSTTNMPAQRLSFAKIAAAGLKSSNSSATPSSQAIVQKQGVTSLARTGTTQTPTPPKPTSAEQATQQKRLMHLSSLRSKDPSPVDPAGPEVQTNKVDKSPLKVQGSSDPDRMLAPTANDDAGTLLSSSSGSAKPPSLDGKSVASGTTFALDEKESLRPDDSASLVAGDDDDAFSSSTMPIPAPLMYGDDGLRAFRDQLREITQMEPPRHALTNPTFGSPLPSSRGVLYVPPPTVGGVGSHNGGVLGTSGPVPSPPDPRLLEAVDNPRDRLMVMKLQTDIVDFVNDAKEVSLILPQINAYHRMLAHKAADYYLLDHESDDSASGVRLFKTPHTCLRPPLIDTTTPSTAASTPPPSAPLMKILRRGMDSGPAIVNGSNITSKTTSESGEGDDDDKKKVPMTREEREARYEAVRLRIMGPAKSADASEEQKPKDSSRSSSAAGKKGKKKQRSDSEDGFEARSAYSHLFPATPQSTNGFTPASYVYPATSHNVAAPHQAYYGYGAAGNFQQYQTPVQPSMQWPTPPYPFANMPQQGYDLSAEFQRAMSLQQGVMSPAAATPSHQMGYPSQYGAGSPWGPQSQVMPQPVPATNTGYLNGYGQYVNTQSPVQDPQPYQYGQLPSQAFPGRPPSKLEHPLPGSYKGKHFDPQSQAFVPNKQSTASSTSGASGSVNDGSVAHSSTPQAPQAPHLPNSYGHASTYGSPRPQHGMPLQNPSQSQPMLHPLPQPVFPRQASPNLPLPAKPGSTFSGHSTAQQLQTIAMQSSASGSSGPSSISKWAAPASLPAKPPPPLEGTDVNGHAQQQHRQVSYNSMASRRTPSGGIQGLGSSSAFTTTNGNGSQR